MAVGVQDKVRINVEQEARAPRVQAGTILHVVDSLGLSGKTKALVDVAVGLQDHGYSSVVCVLDREPSPLWDRLDAGGVEVRSVECADGLQIAVVRQLAGLIREVGADVVHAVNLRPMLYAGLAARLARVRGTVGTLSAFACCVPDRDYSFLPQPLVTKSARNRWRNRIAVGQMRYVTAVSASLGRRFAAYNGIPERKMRVVPYGTNVDEPWRYTESEVAALRDELGLAPGDVVIGSVGRLVEQKDYPTQLKAFALAAQEAPNLRMLLAGGGPDEQALKTMARELGIAERTLFLGHWERVPLLMRALDALVLASKFEPYGVVLLEAKGAGLPILSTSVNEIPEILSNGESGMLVPAETPEPMAKAMVRLAKEPELRKRLSQAALREAHERHSQAARLREYQRLFEEARR